MLDYGIVGNCKTCALISKGGNVEWMCFPSFDSPSVFAKILDRKKGGSFDIAVKGKYKITQNYVENTNILETVFESPRKGFKIIDFFPRYRKLVPSKKKELFLQNRLIRIIKPLKGEPIIKINYDPQLNYASGTTRIGERHKNLIAKNKKSELSLISNLDFKAIKKSEYFTLNETKYFVVGNPDKASDFSVAKCLRLLSWTRKYWLKWVSTLVLPEKHRELITRSALVLKLLTYSKTGAIIAASTTSIPEEIKTKRTWDYRYCWVRDAAFTVDALKKIGRGYEAKKLMLFIIENSLFKKKPLQLMYGIHGETELEEKELSHLAGYKSSRPVRIGNAAYAQKQNDIYGILIDILYLYFVYYEYEKEMSRKCWNFLKNLVDEIKNNWYRKDYSIWEIRSVQEHFTYSKLMCFVGVDRAVKIAQHYNKEDLVEEWMPLAERIKEDILEHGWSKKRKAFTMFYGSRKLDASLLRMTYHEFLDPMDPRILGTVKSIYKYLRTGYLVRRYKMGGDLGISNTAFTICSFWLVDSLYIIREIKRANKIFNKLVKSSNHLGLFSEGIDIESKTLCGNFPQAYTHIALINSAILLSEWSAKRKKIDWSYVSKKLYWP